MKIKKRNLSFFIVVTSVIRHKIRNVCDNSCSDDLCGDREGKLVFIASFDFPSIFQFT